MICRLSCNACLFWEGPNITLIPMSLLTCLNDNKKDLRLHLRCGSICFFFSPRQCVALSTDPCEQIGPKTRREGERCCDWWHRRRSIPSRSIMALPLSTDLLICQIISLFFRCICVAWCWHFSSNSWKRGECVDQWMQVVSFISSWSDVCCFWQLLSSGYVASSFRPSNATTRSCFSWFILATRNAVHQSDGSILINVLLPLC